MEADETRTDIEVYDFTFDIESEQPYVSKFFHLLKMENVFDFELKEMLEIYIAARETYFYSLENNNEEDIDSSNKNLGLYEK